MLSELWKKKKKCWRKFYKNLIGVKKKNGKRSMKKIESFRPWGISSRIIDNLELRITSLNKRYKR